MLIHSVTLQNIRSYQEQTVDFQEGITLLAGDIGSGKSTILLAIEFALFGIRRGEISGDGLLRHGESEGGVTLTFSTNATYTIHRSLKRSSQGVRQDGGYLEVNGRQELLTANELKARILEILGYPSALLTKTKGFVFRYTVYTPQEELKHILYEPDQSRLDTLRAVFGIDRYQQIEQNATLVGRKLREDKRVLVEQLNDQEELSEKARLLADEYAATQKQQDALAKELSALTATHESLLTLQKEQQHVLDNEQLRRQELASYTAKKDSVQRHVASLSSKITAQQSILAQDISVVDDPQQAISEVEEKLSSYNEKRAQARAKRDLVVGQRKDLEEKQSSITALDTCPLCQQDVGSSHKQHISADFSEQQEELARKESVLSSALEKLGQAISQLQERRSSLLERKRLYDASVLAKQKQSLAQETLTALLEEEQSYRKQLMTLEKEIVSRTKPLIKQEALLGLSERINAHQQLLAQKTAQKAVLSERASQLVIRTQDAQKALDHNRAVAQRLSDVKMRERWLSESFIPAVKVMEKHVLSAIHSEFARLFTQWCQTLLDNEHVFATLSHSFAPQVTLAGYDADIAHLSGGEKTSIALAYRLALNVVVNEFIQSLHTSDLLILDEPTDGFSTDQLDRVRDVLQELAVRQVLIVSHEQKLQSFVDHIIPIAKQEGISHLA